MKLEPNTTVSHYKILSSIGKGGMGEVYLAQDTKLNRKVAIKFLSDEFSRDSDKLNRFVREAQSASALNHPNIVTVFEIGEAEGSRYIALEYIEGETLTSVLKKKHQFGSTLDIATQIASALDAAHSAGIVHRDIKPDNVMVRPDGVVKLLDFGIAKLTERSDPDIEPEGETAVHINTSPGMIIGTANYMSPEQAKGRPVDSRTDIFSFGVVMYEMVSGRLPFEGESPLEIIGSILKDEPKPLHTGEIPADLVKMIGKSLRKDPDERYQTMKGLLADLKETKQEMEFQQKLDRTIQPEQAQSETQVFQATTASDAQNTTASGTTNDSISIKRSSIGKVLAGVAAVVILSAIGVGYWYFAGSSSKQIESIAVMPFVNESGNADLEYLADGMTESLITSLSGIPDLSVKARSSVFRYKGKDFDSARIGSVLNVQALLVGRMIPKGNDLSLRLELVDAATETVIWSDSFDKKIGDLVSLQKEIAQDVAKNLRLSLSSEDRDKLAKTYTENSEAHRLYLQGRFHWEKRNLKDFEKAMGYFKQAIEKDPDYAMAYSGLADIYGLIPVYDDSADPKKYIPLARDAALRAIELDPELAEAHASLGRMLFSYYWDFPASERSLKRALEINPDYATAHLWYSEYLTIMNRREDGLAEVRKALELEPFSLVFNRMVAFSLTNSEKDEEAIAQYRKTIDLFPDDATTKVDFAYFLATRKEYAEALRNVIEGLRLEGLKAKWLEKIQTAAKIDGWEGYRKVMAEYGEEQKRVTGHYSSFQLALDYAATGDLDKAFDLLDQAFEERDVRLPSFRQSDELKDYQNDPRFRALEKKMGFPE